MTYEVDVVVIGAGPAGMAAATAIARAGGAVVILDEQAAPGGQIYKGIEAVTDHRPADMSFFGEAYAKGADVVEAFRAVCTDYRPVSTVWHISSLGRGKRREVIVSRDGTSDVLLTKFLVIATGAVERPVPIPGWTLPGVMTMGAVQSALKSSGIYPEGKLVLAGSGPLMLQLATQLIDAHVPIQAIVDTSPRGGFSRATRYLPGAWISFDTLMKGWKLRRKVNASGLPLYASASHLAVRGEDRVTHLSFNASGTKHEIEANLVALHEGVIPNTQLTRLVEAKHAWDTRQRYFHPVTDRFGETSESGIYAVGDSGRIEGADAAVRSGAITGLAVAERLGLLVESARDLEAEEQRLRHFVVTAIRPFLDSYFPPPDWIGQIADKVVICRCEDVTAGQLRQAVAKGCSGPNQAKAFLRCGMGPCQGRMCASTVTEVIAAANGLSPSDVGSYRIRPPIKPVTLAEVAALHQE